MTPRVVFDCMVLLQAAARATGPAAACLQAVRANHLELFLSPEIVAEVRDVLTRPKVRRKFPDLIPEAVDLFLRDVADNAFELAQVPQVFILKRDPKDEPYINLALAVGASYLVSRDQDLLDLMNDEDFRQRFPGLTVLDPPALLRELARTQHEPEVPEPESTDDLGQDIESGPNVPNP